MTKETYELTIRSMIEMSAQDGVYLSRTDAERMYLKVNNLREEVQPGAFRRCPACQHVKGVYQDGCPVCGVVCPKGPTVVITLAQSD